VGTGELTHELALLVEIWGKRREQEGVEVPVMRLDCPRLCLRAGQEGEEDG
jgi:hypothetical protein